MKNFLTLLCLFAFVACGEKHQTPPSTGGGNEDPPPAPPERMEKMLWMDADESFMTNFSTGEKITALLDKIKDTGFNKIVVDVRPVEGTVLYDSDFMPAYGDADERGWDYLDFMIKEAGKRDIKVTASMVVFGAGFMKDASRDPSKGRSRGVAWSDPELEDLVCMEYKPDGRIISAMEDTQTAKNAAKLGAGGFIFLNPVHPDSQAYVMRFIEELVSKYDFDALALDYCRFPDQQSDFSDFTRGEFEKYLGKKTVNWPKEIFTYGTSAPDSPMTPGVYYKKWWQFRAGIIRDFIKRIRTAIKEINPDVRLEYWAGSWLSQGSGQNWASPSYNLSADADAGWYYSQWMTAEYSTTGFADLLDTFLLGTYMTNTYMGAGSPDGSYQDPDSPSEPYPQESMEYQIARGQRYVGKACTLYGNVAGTGSANVVEEQIYYCLKNSAGVMVFDICHFINDEAKWAGFKKGIARAEKELAEEAER